MSRNKYALSAHFAACVRSAPIVFADIGAFGQLQEPWSAFPPGSLRVVGFEPDPSDQTASKRAADELTACFPVALWNENTELTLHVAATGGASSVHPPNEAVLRWFAEEYERPRSTVRKINVKAQTLDSVATVARLKFDFLKLDTQGAEDEILHGAESVLREQALGVVTETWTSEVHKGQALSGDILSWMNQLGFDLFDIGIAAAWERRSAAKLGIFDKRQIIGLDFLFFKRLEALHQQAPATDALKLAALADLFGFTGYALDVIDAFAAGTGNQALTVAKDHIVRTARKSVLDRPRRAVRRLLRELGYGGFQEYPLLHY